MFHNRPILDTINVLNLWSFDMPLNSVGLGDLNVLDDRNILNSIDTLNLGNLYGLWKFVHLFYLKVLHDGYINDTIRVLDLR